MFEVLTYPNKILSSVSESVAEFNEELASTCHSLIETMRFHNGIGIAAPQVGLLQRIIVIEHSSLGAVVMINPVIEFMSPQMAIAKEGCLSIPGVHVPVQRSSFIAVKYNDLSGKENKLMLTEIDARVAQHEIDHLNGLMMVQKASKRRIKK